MNYLQVGAMSLHLDAKRMNKLVKEYIGTKAESITHKPELRMDIAQVFLEMVTKYVPMKTGHLREGGHVESGHHAGGDARLVWYAHKKGFDYATQQFETQYQHYTTPGTGSNWTGTFVRNKDDWADFIMTIKPLIIAAYKEGFNE